MKNSKRHITSIKEILDYLSIKLTGRERNTLEKQLERDAFEMEAMEGLEMLTPDEFSEDITELHGRLHKKTSGRNFSVLYRTVAGIAAIIVVGVLFFTLTQKKIEDIPIQKTVAEEKLEPIEKEKTEKNMQEEQRVKSTEPEKEVFIQKDIAPTEESGEELAFEFDEDEMTDEIAVKEMDRELAGKGEITVQEQISARTEGLAVRREKAIAGADVQISEPATSQADDREIRTNKKSLRLQEPKAAAREIEVLPGMNMENVITGTVIDAYDSLPIPGVNIVVKDDTDYPRGTITDMEGRFAIPIGQDTTVTLVANMVGMEQKEVEAVAGKMSGIALEPDMLALDEVVVVGYGITKKSDLPILADWGKFLVTPPIR